MFRNRSIGCRLIVGGLAIMLLAFLVWMGSVAYLVRSLQGRATRMLQMANDPTRLNLSLVAGEVHDARQELTFLRAELAPLLWIGARVGGDLAVGEPMADAGVESIIAADEAVGALASSLSDMPLGSLSMSAIPRVLDALVTARPALERSRGHMDLAAAALARIKGPLSPQVEKWVGQVTKLVELADQGLGAALVAPELLARDGSRTYLILVQNSDEIRPTGGFISTIGRIEISHGVVISQTFEDGYAVDDFSKYYPDPPQPLFDYMSAEQWLVRDANWSPDFPTTARDVMRLYQIGRPGKVDGVIGMNQKTVQLLMAGLEPLSVKGIDEPVTTANVEEMFRTARDSGVEGISQPEAVESWAVGRKQFIGEAVHAAIDKLATGKVNWTRLGQGMIEALRQRQLTIYTVGPEAEMLRTLHWDGALRPEHGDYLMIVDSNIGFSKANPLISEKAAYWVALEPDGSGHAIASLSYLHQGTKTGIICTPIDPIATKTATYDEMMNRCYNDYVRLVVPQGSRLRGADAHPVPGKYLASGQDADGIAQILPDEAGRALFGQFFVVEYGQPLQTRFQYDLREVVSVEAETSRYTLFLQKQSGTVGLPVTVTVSLPDRAHVLAATPLPTSQSDTQLEFDLNLDTDKQVQVVYSIAP